MYALALSWLSANVTNLIRGHKIPHILLHHLPLDGEALDIRGCRFGGDDIFKCITFAEVYLDQPGREHHALRTILRGLSVGSTQLQRTYPLVDKVKLVR